MASGIGFGIAANFSARKKGATTSDREVCEPDGSSSIKDAGASTEVETGASRIEAGTGLRATGGLCSGFSDTNFSAPLTKVGARIGRFSGAGAGAGANAGAGAGDEAEAEASIGVGSDVVGGVDADACIGVSVSVGIGVDVDLGADLDGDGDAGTSVDSGSLEAKRTYSGSPGNSSDASAGEAGSATAANSFLRAVSPVSKK